MAKVEATTALILFKTEATYGVDPVPVETDAILVRNLTLDPQVSTIDKPRMGATHISKGKDIGKIFWNVSFEVDAVGAGDPGGGAYPEPRYAAFLKACSMEVTTTGIAPNEVHTYTYKTRGSSGQSSVTMMIVFFELGGVIQKVHELNGCRFTMEFSIGVDEPGIFTFAGSGLHNDPAVGAYTLASIDYGDTGQQDDSCNGKGLTLTRNAVDVCATSFKFKGNRSVAEVDCVNATYGVQEFYVTSSPGQVYEIDMDDLDDTAVTNDEWDQLQAQTKTATLLSITTVQGSLVAWSLPKVQRDPFSYEDDNGVRRITGTYCASDDTQAGDDAVSVAFSYP